MLSPGVFIEEIDASTIVPSVSMSVATFGGEFTKGPTGSYMLITSVDDLIDFYGLPTDENYNQWYQCYNFLQYGNTLYVSRAINKGSVNASKGIGKKIVDPGTGTGTETGSGLVTGDGNTIVDNQNQPIVTG